MPIFAPQIAEARIHCRRGTEHTEQHRIRRNFEVEIDQAVNENAANSQQGSQRENPIHIRRPVARLLPRTTNGRESVVPATVNRTVYAPGVTNGPRVDPSSLTMPFGCFVSG